MTKAKEIAQFIKDNTRDAIGLACLDMTNREQADVLRVNRRWLADEIAGHLTERYRLLELFDIVEWRRQRVRR